MVGVPGRSKACNTCKQRKVACSLEKPECRTCIKASRVCAGYQRERVFILDERTSSKGPKDSNSKTRPAIQVDNVFVVARKQRNAPQEIQIDRRGDSASGTSQIETYLNTLAPSTRSVYRQQILSESLLYFLPSTYGVSEKKEWLNGNWLPMLPSLPDFTTALEASILAVSMAKLGRVHNNPVLMHESLRFYGKGLWELQRALWDPKLMYKDSTLASCMALIMYEVVECPDRKLDGWLSHMKGCAKLFELKGPEAYTSDFGHQLFLSFRLIEIQQAFAERRATYLAKPEWLELPFKDRPKTTFHVLLDIIAIVPAILADGYKLLTPPAEGSQIADPTTVFLAVLGLVDRCWKVDSQLRNFYTNLEDNTLGPIYWPELSTEGDIQEDADLGKVFPVAFKFLNIKSAHICMLYWATSAILWSGMVYTYQLLGAVHAPSPPLDPAAPIPDDGNAQANAPLFNIADLPPLEHRTDIATMARNICQSVEYCLKDAHLGWGARAAVFPLKVAIETLHDAPGCHRELQWAAAAMKRVDESGIRIMSHLPTPMTDHAFLPG